MRWSNNNRRHGARGVAFLAAIITLLTLAIFGASVVAIVAVEQEARVGEYERLQGFYAAMSGLEYGLTEVVNGGYPNVEGKPFAGGEFSTTIHPSIHALVASGATGQALRSYQVTVPLLAGDCAGLDTTGSVPVGPEKDEINQVRLRKFCLNKVRLDRLQLAWTPDLGQRLLQVTFDGQVVYNDATGAVNGATVDLVDALVADATDHRFDRLLFTASIQSTVFTLTVYFTDGSPTNVTWAVE